MDHISVCICTYKRPQLLNDLLHALSRQFTRGLFCYSIVVVDNDKLGSAQQAVSLFRANMEFHMEVIYCIEPEQNISLARNLAVKLATGNIIAFIDDDEVPNDDWLLQLFMTMHNYDADGVLGPVVPRYAAIPPKWIIRGKLLERPTHTTGTILKPRDTRTGNLLLKANIFRKERPFDPRFGRTGGEDGEFFRRIAKKGYRFIWSDEAVVDEIIPASRFKIEYFLKRAILRGVTEAWLSSDILVAVPKSFSAIITYSLALPVLLVLGHHHFIKYLIKTFDHIGKILALCGLELLKERSF